MGFSPGGSGGPGGLFHWVTKTENGLRVIDVWESRETFEKFSEEKIGPFSREVGITDPPVTQFFEGFRWKFVPERLAHEGPQRRDSFGERRLLLLADVHTSREHPVE